MSKRFLSVSGISRLPIRNEADARGSVVLVTTRGAALEVRLGRPAKLNAMDAAAWATLREAIERAERDPALRAVVIRGDERAYCAGNDITAMVDAERRGEAAAYFLEGMLPTFTAMATASVPVVSVVEGLALGGGVELLAFSDLVIASSTARFGLPETRIGVWPTVFVGASGPTHSRRAGTRLALTGEHVDTETALLLGIATHACDSGEIEAVLDHVLAGIAAGAPDAVARTKAWLNRDLVETGLPRCREALLELCDQTMNQPEFCETVAAFGSRRRTPVEPE
jgi:enoyl-CoA hydratase/carnithine racemase